MNNLDTRKCIKCGIEKNIKDFYNSKTKYYKVCKKCYSKKKHPEVKCPICNKTHHRGSDNRRSKICKECYPKYRYAVNLLHSSLFRAKRYNIEHDLTIEWIMERLTTCPKTGIEFSFSHNGNNYSNRSPYTPSIDKVDPTKGYTKDNCVIVCWWYNVSKQRFTDEEVLELCRRVVDTYTIQTAINAEVPTH